MKLDIGQIAYQDRCNFNIVTMLFIALENRKLWAKPDRLLGVEPQAVL
jgi:hypothetical protein